MAGSKPRALEDREDERALVEAARRDPARFADLYEIHFELVYAYIARRVRDRDVAEDLTSEVFHKALANLGTFEWRGAPFAAWLIRIAANALADHSKRAAREAGSSGARHGSHRKSRPAISARGRSSRRPETRDLRPIRPAAQHS